MQLGEVVFGGVGSGLYGMLVFAILAVFIAGLMIGRTPEYLGKKIETFEMKMVAIAILVTPLLVLGGTALAVLTEAGRAGLANPGRTASRSALRLQLGGQQQRQRLRRAVGQHALLQPEPGGGHGAGPLRRHRAGAGHRRLAGRQEAPGRDRGHPAHPWPAVHRC
jgi:K+-transporting ATPase ATPase A chain